MKALLLTLFLASTTFLFPVDQQLNPTSETTSALSIEEEAPKRISVRAGVDFGRKKKNCRGFGICRAYVAASDSKTGTRATLVVSGNKVSAVLFHKKMLTKVELGTYFRDGVFVMEESFRTELRSGETDFVLQLKAGRYRLKENRDTYELVIGK